MSGDFPRVGLLDRIFNRHGTTSRPAPTPAPTLVEVVSAAASVLLGGRHDLEVVGESHYQDALRRVGGGRTTERVRVETQAMLVREPDNPYDANAISVRIEGSTVGYLCRDDARSFLPGLLKLEARYGARISLAGVVVGGGIRQDGPGMLGIWLSYDPVDFDLVAIVPPPVPALAGAMRTGLTEALLTDAEDDLYDLSWLHRLPSDALSAIPELRRLLEHDPDPIDRHFMFCELEDRLYRSRDVFASALTEYDDTCERHDAEMDGIRDALLAKFGEVPVLETYRQMAMRQQKVEDWQRAIWWAERGLALYGGQAAWPESVDDLRNRLAAYQSKLTAPATPGRKATPNPDTPPTSPTIEVLVCEACGSSFDRVVVRGRKPKNCPGCR
jgi:HIRAN domain